jgi:hypothetical protein
MTAQTDARTAGTASTDRQPSLSKTIVWLTALAGALGLVVAGVGVLMAGDADLVTASSIRGETVDLYDRGVYQFDTVFHGANNRSTDLVTLLFGLPLLAVSLRWFLQGSLRGGFLLLGTLGFFVYGSVGYALGAVAYNDMFLVYVAYFSASLFAFVVTFAALFVGSRQSVDGLPRRGPGVFMLSSGVVVLAIWMMDPIGALLEGGPPRGLDTYTTLFTHAFDMAVIAPAAIAAGVMILGRHWAGYVTAFSLLVLEALLMPIITIATILQFRLGVTFTPPEVVGPIAGFSILAVAAVWVIVAVLRRIPESTSDTA